MESYFKRAPRVSNGGVVGQQVDFKVGGAVLYLQFYNPQRTICTS